MCSTLCWTSFARPDPEQFGRCLLLYHRSPGACTPTRGAKSSPSEVIAVDGKAIRHSFDAATGQAALHLVSAWGSEAGLSLGQAVVDRKSSEVTAIPALLKLLDIAWCVITMDAMGCQRAIARQIVNRGRGARVSSGKRAGSGRNPAARPPSFRGSLWASLWAESGGETGNESGLI
ncbi:MAG: ISAs1 family transposase [Armatimonadetes bacterium]|nr:ISAs1 family transposase [Armatimonadota bacterium]